MILSVYKISKFIGSILLVVAICSILSLPACADPSEYRTSLTRQALESGFQQSSIELLSPVPEQGKQVVAQQLLSLLKAGSLGRDLVVSELNQARDSQRVLSYVDENSSLDVYADGSRFRFRGDIDNLKGTENIAANKLEERELESLGRTFITKNFGNFVKLGENEKLTFLGTRYLHNGGTDLQRTVKNEVVANIAVFGREVQGIPVVGAGSKIAVWFGGDKEPVAFDVDWPNYKLTNQKQEILPKDMLRRRIEAISIVPKDASDVRLSRFECGYVDLGATKRSKVLQAGCSVAYDGRTGPASPTGERLQWARIEFVPAGAKVLADSNWALAEFIARQGEPKPGLPQLDIPTRAKDPGNEPSR